MTIAVPVIDIAPFLSGSDTGKHRVARELGIACEDVGFFLITGHGVPEALVEETMDVSRAFFDLPVSEKLETAPPRRDYPRGYSRLMDESLAYSAGGEAPPDLKEALAMGQVTIPDDDYYRSPAAGLAFVDNLWPRRPARLKPVWTLYFQAMETLAAHVMRIFALALELREDFFDDKIDRHVSVMRALNYPEQNAPALPGQLRAGEHTDFGSLTILLQEDRLGGLQVRNRDQGWVDVHPVANSFTVNIGDLMAMWTNDRWVSTPHRVANPPAQSGAVTRRQSIAFFQQPNYDALIECIETCTGPGRPARHPPITSGEHMTQKILKTRMMPVRAAV
jgi:isopenicillin N synthase-like dioxygenase